MPLQLQHDGSGVTVISEGFADGTAFGNHSPAPLSGGPVIMPYARIIAGATATTNPKDNNAPLVKVLASGGGSVGSEIEVSSVYAQTSPPNYDSFTTAVPLFRVTPRTGGGWSGVFTSFGPSPSFTATTKVRLFDSSSTPEDDNVTISTTLGQVYSVAPYTSDGFAVLYSSGNLSTYDNIGSGQASQTWSPTSAVTYYVNGHPFTFNQFVRLNNGNYLLSWLEILKTDYDGGDTSRWRLKARIYDSGLTDLSGIIALSDSNYTSEWDNDFFYSILPTSDNGFIVVFLRNTETEYDNGYLEGSVRARRFNSSGVASGSSVQLFRQDIFTTSTSWTDIDKLTQTATIDSSNRVVLAVQHNIDNAASGLADFSDIVSRIYVYAFDGDSSFAAIGTSLVAESNAVGNANPIIWEYEPTICTRSDGSFQVFWWRQNAEAQDLGGGSWGFLQDEISLRTRAVELVNSGVTGTLNATLGPLTLGSAGAGDHDGDDVLSATARVRVRVRFAKTDATDAVSSATLNLIKIDANLVDDYDGPPIEADFSKTDATDSISASLSAPIPATASFAIFDDDDVLYSGTSIRLPPTSNPNPKPHREVMQDSVVDGLIALYEIDITNHGGPKLYWTPGPLGSQTGNLVLNGNFYKDTEEWSFGGSEPPSTAESATGADRLSAYGSAIISRASLSAGAYMTAKYIADGSEFIPCLPGQWWELQGLVQPRACQVRARLSWYDEGQNLITSTTGDLVANASSPSQAFAFRHYAKVWVNDQAPANAKFVVADFVIHGVGEGSATNPALVLTQVLLRQGLWPSLSPAPWSQGGVYGSVVFQGNGYVPVPIQVEGIEISGSGSVPRPRVTVPNVSNFASALMGAYKDLLGCKVTRLRTFVRFLDTMPTADPTAYFGPDIWYIDRVTERTKQTVSFELAAKLDLQGKMIPGRVVLKDACTHTYRFYSNGSFIQGSCPYTGGNYFKQDGTTTGDPAEDNCGRRLKDCKLRFENNPLQTRAFPGIKRYRV